VAVREVGPVPVLAAEPSGDDEHMVSFGIFELVDDFLDLFLTLDEVNIVSDPLSTTSFELSVIDTSRSCG